MQPRNLQDAHWRDAARSVRFFFWDGKAAFPLVVFLFYMRLSTLIVTLLSVVFFSILNRFGYSPVVFLRLVRSLLSGPRKLSRPWWMNRSR